jgi:hypothetical protein
MSSAVLTDFTFTVCIPLAVLVYHKRSRLEQLRASYYESELKQDFVMMYVYFQFLLAIYCAYVKVNQSSFPLL